MSQAVRRAACAVLPLAVVAALGACSGAGDDAATVTADVYSGRENPSWGLADDEAEAVVAAIDALGRAAEPPASPPTSLGFRGFTVDGLDPGSDDAFLVTTDAVLRLDPTGTVVEARTDGAGTAYSVLLESARDSLPGDVVDAVETGAAG
ncbi:hypothetical protein [Oerskovia flava]|uniref:hypothetical protein n=1 Tax=Oerskovia flava TaxID=2986422 RepID=UPI00223EB043|nr:hypothetical protein [Oerskovia sp. JB1-3-2]